MQTLDPAGRNWQRECICFSSGKRAPLALSPPSSLSHLQSIFSLSYLQASLIQLAFFTSYFIFAQPAGWLIERIGYQRTMVVGLVIMAAGALLFLPAASTAIYGIFEKNWFQRQQSQTIHFDFAA